jgi:DNA-binding beta-propeller fold protein YncE
MSRLIPALIVVGVLGVGHTALAQGPIWTRVAGSTRYDRSLAVAVDADKNVYQAGTTQGPFDGQKTVLGEAMCLIKYDASGTKLWTRFYGSKGVYPWAMAVDASNNVYVTGVFSDRLLGQKKRAGQEDLFLLKLDRDGNEIWIRTASSKGNDFAAGLAIGASGNVYVAGYASAALDGQPNAGDYDIVLLKYNPAGERLWLRTQGTAKSDLAQSIALDAQENLFVAGSTTGPVSIPKYELNDIYVAKYDKDGNKLWQRLLGGERADEAEEVAVDSQGNVYVAAYSHSDLDGLKAVGDGGGKYLIKLDSKGTKLWTRVVTPMTIGRLAVDRADNIYLAGNTVHRSDCLLFQYDRDGALRWGRRWGTPEDDWITAMAIDADGIVYVAGETAGRPAGQKNAGDADLYLVKYNPRPPSFDCAKAKSVQEVLICQSARLSSLDSEIDQLYQANLDTVVALFIPGATEADVKADQLRWMRSRRNACTTAEQLEAAMTERVASLTAILRARNPGQR